MGKPIHIGKTVKSRDFARILASAGGEVIRKRGDHHLYKMPSGNVIPLPVGGKHRDVSPNVRQNIRRALRAEGIAC
jgi:predicted RNA binding protein YcfA (HicA-like mRNA interferase family)